MSRYAKLDDLQLGDRLDAKREFCDRQSLRLERTRKGLIQGYTGEHPDHSGQRVTDWDRLNKDPEMVEARSRLTECQQEISAIQTEIAARKSAAR